MKISEVTKSTFNIVDCTSNKKNVQILSYQNDEIMKIFTQLDVNSEVKRETILTTNITTNFVAVYFKINIEFI